MNSNSNTKILLRRPKLTSKPLEKIPGQLLPIPSVPTCKSVAEIRDDIEYDIQLFENDILGLNQPNEDNSSSKHKESTQESDLLRKGKLPCVSVCSIERGLLPSGDGVAMAATITKDISFDRQMIVSNKTIRQFENIKRAPLKPIKETRGFQNVDLYKQVRDTIPLFNLALPKHIIIIQMAALLKQQMTLEEDNQNYADYYHHLQCLIRKIPPNNLDGDFSVNTNPKFEILLCENPDKPQSPLTSQKLCDMLQNDLEKIKMEKLNTKHNVAQNSSEDLENISAVQVSMMECFLGDQEILDFRAHSIWEIPDIAPVFPNLTVLDLSYNNFQKLPQEISNLLNLELLILKNNPISNLPASTFKPLRNLSKLDCSFTLVSSISPEIFEDCKLEEADLSYSKLQYFPCFAGKSRLRILNLAGNPIKYFKKPFLDLPIEKLGLKNTWTSPVYWPEGVFEEFVTDKSWYYCDICGTEIHDMLSNTVASVFKFNHYLPVLLSFCSEICTSTMC